jgi:hypothetical protein
MRRPGQIGAVADIRAGRTNAMNGIGDRHIPGVGNIAATERGDTAFGGRERP